MKENKASLYAIYKARDLRFDGHFFVGISSTKIYCRPICKAKQAKQENCTFFSTAAEAEKEGYRPCLLCRPELAPGNSKVDAYSTLAHRAVKIIEENCGEGLSIEELAKKLECSSRHLRRVFVEEYNVTPIQFLQTYRLLLAKNLLTDTNLSILEIAMASGFNSLRRLNDLFQKKYKLPPSVLRKNLKNGKNHNNEISVELGYHPPYCWNEIINFLSKRAIPEVEVVSNEKYMRTVSIIDRNQRNCSGWVCVRNNPINNSLVVTLSESLIPVLPQVLARIKHLFDLYCEPNTIYETLQSMNEIIPNSYILGIRVPECFDSFEMAVRAILGQQITVKAATTLAGRIAKNYGKGIETGIAGLTKLFPSAKNIIVLGNNIEEHLGSLGIIRTKARAILALAEAIENKKIKLENTAKPELEIKKLLEIKGIGSWTANYIAMRTMSWTDVFLETDVGIKNALPNYKTKELIEISKKWSPWRSYAMMVLWNSLEEK